MGLSLARLLEAESKYIELSRSLDEDPGTALALEEDSICGAMSRNFAEQEEYLAHLLETREQFAQGQRDNGFQPFLLVIDFPAAEGDHSACQKILAESGRRMHEFGPARMEYLILAIAAMEMCLE